MDGAGVVVGAGDVCAAGGVEGCTPAGAARGGAEGGAGGRDVGGGGATAHAPSTPAVNNALSALRAWPLLQSPLPFLRPAMWLILLEAALALGMLVFIVWWTMFHRPRRKPPEDR